MAATNWTYPAVGTLQGKLETDGEGYIIASGDSATGTGTAKNFNLSGIVVVPGNNEATTDWGKMYRSFMALFGIIPGTGSDYTGYVDFTIKIDDQEISSEEGN